VTWNTRFPAVADNGDCQGLNPVDGILQKQAQFTSGHFSETRVKRPSNVRWSLKCVPECHVTNGFTAEASEFNKLVNAIQLVMKTA